MTDRSPNIRPAPPGTSPVRITLTTQVKTLHTIHLPIVGSLPDDEAEAFEIACAELERDLLISRDAGTQPLEARITHVLEEPEGVEDPYDYKPTAKRWRLGEGKRVLVH